MSAGPHPKKYPQPYNSKHVINSTSDLIRNDEPLYIKKFPKFLSTLYRKQVQFTPQASGSNRPSPVAVTTEDRSSSRKSLVVSPTNTISSSANQQQQTGFKTLGQIAATNRNIQITTKSPTQMSAMPSDFEHIFHYSETQ